MTEERKRRRGWVCGNGLFLGGVGVFFSETEWMDEEKEKKRLVCVFEREKEGRERKKDGWVGG